LVDEAVATHEQITVTRNGEPAVVILSVEDFDSLVETLAILQNPADRAEFERARREADEGDMIDEEEMASLMRERLAKRDELVSRKIVLTRTAGDSWPKNCPNLSRRRLGNSSRARGRQSQL
jgi:antitoxin YefM